MTPSFAQVRINEVVASNSNGLQDEDGDSPDWIELFNAGNETVNLAGFGISDDSEEKFQFTLPNVTIEADSFLVLYADDKDKYVDSTGSIHLNFKLSSDGETVFLSSVDAALMDSLTFPKLESDESFGLSSAVDGGYFIFTNPTPSATNPEEGYLTRLEKPEMDTQGGFYSGSVEVTISNGTLVDHMYYTTDGTDPTSTSPVFGAEPKTFNSTTVLKLRTIQDGMLSSEIEVQTYFIDVNHDLPVVSLVTDPDYFFDESDGIYINYEAEIEVPAHVELYEEDGSMGFKAHIGTQIYGSYSQRFDQKSLAIYFRGEYGPSELEYELFEEKNIDKFQSFILRNAGNDFGGAHMRDAAMTTIIEDVVDLDYQAYRPAVLYINGEYWGIQNIREKISEHFVASNHNMDAGDVDLLEAGEVPQVVNGSADDWMNFWEELENADVTNQEEYDAVVSHIDIDNFIDYMATEIFYANTDWPAINNKFWKESSPEGKWKWIIYDTDHGFNLYSGDGDYNLDMFEHTLQTNPNLLKYGNPLWSTYIFRTLIENEGFKTQFVTRLSGLMNTAFETDRMIAIIDSLASIIESEIPAHEERWGLVSGWTGQGPFISQVEDMRDFARRRHTYVYQHMQAHLGLSDLGGITVDISNNKYGTVQVNRSMVDTFPWTGTYFADYEVPVTAIPKTGYQFTEWTGDVESAEHTIMVSTRSEVTANFEPATGITSDIVINEIMYNAADEEDTGDWIELFNNTSSAIDISEWVVKDEDDDHIFTFPAQTELGANSYLVVANDLDAFNQYYSNVGSLFGELGYGLAGGSDQVRLFDDEGTLIDIVSYDDESPWPPEADGTGFTLELSDPNTDNLDAENWNASTAELGTPGAANSVLVSMIEETEVPERISLKQNYPNPFNPTTNITYELSEKTSIKLTVFDMLGRTVSVLEQGIRPAGVYSLSWNASGQSSGMYMYRLEAGDDAFVKKMLLIK